MLYSSAKHVKSLSSYEKGEKKLKTHRASKDETD